MRPAIAKAAKGLLARRAGGRGERTIAGYPKLYTNPETGKQETRVDREAVKSDRRTPPMGNMRDPKFPIAGKAISDVVMGAKILDTEGKRPVAPPSDAADPKESPSSRFARRAKERGFSR